MKILKWAALALMATLIGVGPAASQTKLTLMLDWFPNVDHLPIYVARQSGLFADQGLEIKIISPSETSDALKLAAAGKVDLAVSYQPQTIIAASRGIQIRAVGRLISHPLCTLLFLKDKGIKTPQDLSGKRIGYTVPGLMDVLLEAFAKINGIKNYTAVNVGFAIAPSLTANKVDAVMGPFKTYETVTMSQKGLKVDFFELENYGIPVYDELVFVASSALLNQKPDAIAKFMNCIQKAMIHTRANPDAALAEYLKAVPEADRQTESAAFQLTLPYYAQTQQFAPQRWQAFADFALKYGLIENKVDARALITDQRR